MGKNIKNASVISLSWPIFVSSLMSIMLGYVDTVMLSQYNEDAVGAIGNANTILGFLTLTFTVVSGATGILTAQYLGAKVTEKLSQVYSVSILFNLILSVFISLILFAFNEPLMNLLNVPVEIQPDAASYMKIVGGLIFADSLFSNFGQIFRSNGKTKISMVLALLMNVINIAGDYLVLYGPLKQFDFGVSGVATVTALSRIAVMIVAVIYFIFKIDYSIPKRHTKLFSKDILKQLLRLGVPSAGESICYDLSQVAVVAIVNYICIIENSTVALNTRVYCNMLFSFSYLCPLSLAVGTQIIVGHSVGENDYDFAYRRVIKTLKIALTVSVVVALANFLLSGFTLSIFSNNPDVIALGRQIMFIGIFLEFGRCTNIVIIDSMKAAGDVKFPVMLGIFSMWCICVLLAFILGIVCGMGLIGVWIAMAADEIFRGIVVAVRWKRGTWRGKRVVENN